MLHGSRVVVVNWRDIDHSLSGGAEIYAWQFARALREGGADVRFVTARERGQAARADRDGIAVRRGGGTLGFYLFTLLWLLRHRRDIDAVIDPAGGLPSFSPLVLRRRTPVLLVIHHVHQAQFGVHFPAPVAALGRWLERVAMRRVYRRHPTVAVSASTAEQMRSRLGWAGDIRILENGADLPGHTAREAAAAAGAKDPDRIVILGRLVTHKRVDLALAAVRRAQAAPELAGRTLRVDVIGRGPEHDRLVQLAGEHGMADRVTFHGYLPGDRRDALLARAAVQLCASDAEGWGQVVIDAAAHGVPTIARDVPGLRDSIQPGRTGWLVPDSDDPAFVVARLGDTLADVLATTPDEASRIARSEACRAWADHFDWSRMRADAREITTQLLGRVPTPPEHHHPRDARVAV